MVRSLGGDATTIEIPAHAIDRDSFAPFGELIEPRPDGTPFGAEDAPLDLASGTPRFYVMRLPCRGMTFDRITRHRRVTQCLAAVGGGRWYLAVAPPNALEDPTAEPAREEITGFCIPGDVAVMLRKGTWHAGPLFEENEMCFFNLELSNTNEVDHQSSLLAERFGARWRLRRLAD